MGDKENAIKVLNYLNKTTGKHFRPTDTTLKPIILRLKDGFTLKDCLDVIDTKNKEWSNNPKMTPYLRPSTLFGATNFNNYIGEVPINE